MKSNSLNNSLFIAFWTLLQVAWYIWTFFILLLEYDSTPPVCKKIKVEYRGFQEAKLSESTAHLLSQLAS